MNILLMNGLPDEYEGVPISPDFRNMIQLELILQDETLDVAERCVIGLTQLYPDIPNDTNLAIKGLQWFIACGREPAKRDEPKEKIKAYDLEQDADMIYASFYAAYHISLTTIDFLHWWEFMALFNGLPDDTPIKQAMYWRTVDLSGMTKETRQHALKMRKLYRLEEPEQQRLSIEELDRRTRADIQRRYEEVQHQKKEREKVKQ